MFRNAVFVLAALSVATGCSDGVKDDTDAPEEESDGCGGSLSADIDGSGWDADLEVCAVNDSGVFNVTGSDNDGNQLAVTVLNADANTFSIDGVQNNGRWNEGTQTFLVIAGATAGTVTFDSFDEAGADGTFSFTATDVTASEDRVVTNGTFNVEF